MSSQNTEDEALEIYRRGQERIREREEIAETGEEDSRRSSARLSVNANGSAGSSAMIDSAESSAIIDDGDIPMQGLQARPTPVSRKKAQPRKRLSRSPEKSGSPEKRRSGRGVRDTAPAAAPPQVPAFPNEAALPARQDIRVLKDSEEVPLSESGLDRATQILVADSIMAYVERGVGEKENAASLWFDGKWQDKCFHTVCFTNKGSTNWTGGLTGDDLSQACKTCPETRGGINPKIAKNPCILFRAGKLVLLPNKTGSFRYWI